MCRLAIIFIVIVNKIFEIQNILAQTNEFFSIFNIDNHTILKSK